MSPFSPEFKKHLLLSGKKSLQPDRIWVPGAVCTGTLLAVAVSGALLRMLDSFFLPFAWLAGFHVFLYVWLWSVLREKSSLVEGKGEAFRKNIASSLDAGGRFLSRSLILSLLALVLVSSGGLFHVLESPVWVVLLAPFQWLGAGALLLLAFSSFAVVTALGCGEHEENRVFFPLLGWALFSGSSVVRSWVVMFWTFLLAWFFHKAFYIVCLTHGELHKIWQYSFLGSRAGLPPPPEFSSTVVALNISLLLALLPVFGHLVVLTAHLGKPDPQH